jgi:hypothetical protein
MDQFGVNPHEVIALCEYLNCTNDPFVTYEELTINGGPKRGDILEISRNGYQHLVLYDEEGICYHVALTGDAKENQQQQIFYVNI